MPYPLADAKHPRMPKISPSETIQIVPVSVTEDAAIVSVAKNIFECDMVRFTGRGNWLFAFEGRRYSLRAKMLKEWLQAHKIEVVPNE